jgi:hypothetical protein
MNFAVIKPLLLSALLLLISYFYVLPAYSIIGEGYNQNIYHILSGTYFRPLFTFPYQELYSQFIKLFLILLLPFLFTGTINTYGAIWSVALFFLLGYDWPAFGGGVFLALLLKTPKNSLKSGELTSLYIIVCSSIGTLLLGPSALLWVCCALFLKPPHFSIKQRIIAVAPPLILTFLTTISPVLPLLPPHASIVLDDGSAGLLRPLFGRQAAAFQITNRYLLKDLFWLPALFIGSAGLFFLKIKGFRNRLATALFVVSFCLISDIVLPESLSEIAPISTLSRMVPGLFNAPLTTVCIAISMSLLLLLATHSTEKIVATFCLLSITLSSFSHETLIKFNTSNFQFFQAPSQSPLMIATPWLKAIKRNNKPTVLINISTVECYPEQNCSFIIDKRKQKRWFSQRQIGKEYIRLRTSSEALIHGIILNHGNFETDFARVLSITDCQSQRVVLPPYRWPGALYETSRHILYFKPQTVPVSTILLAQPVRTSCLEVRQLGTELNYDWSLVEASLF